ncbi:cytochrome b [Marinibacterium profundimaris]|uniref:Cytochrome B561 n=1 Tax=Marinibacterium profundimaris TaxID=1679460 RepID=A0A225NBJ9_9RHOB|nr:cytochrome b/b6 domain-containing protein [Marinibacterium profundimaris]OWU68056.1 cytochrome B561 [Marinibacterium profundimaris]
MTDPSQDYRTPARLLHWIVALFVLLTIPAGFIMIQDGLARPVQNTLFVFHKNIGVILFLLVLLRLAYRWLRPPPPVPETLHPLQAMAARVSHVLLYTLLLVMPLAGYIRVRAGRFPIEGLDALGIGTLVPRSEALANAAKALHFYGAYAIAALIAIHIGAALLHGLILRDGVFARMWPPLARRR